MPARKNNPAKIARQEARSAADEALQAVHDLDRAQFAACDGQQGRLTPAMEAEYDAARVRHNAAVELRNTLHR